MMNGYGVVCGEMAMKEGMAAAATGAGCGENRQF